MGTKDAAHSFFTAPHYCYSSHEKRLSRHDKLRAGSVICASSNFALIHLYILDGKHSLRAAINYAAGAVEERSASWGVAGACLARGRGKEGNGVYALVKKAAAGRDPARHSTAQHSTANSPAAGAPVPELTR